MLIKIFGGKGEGKSTLAQVLEKFLREQGVEVENTDGDRYADSDLSEHLQKMSQHGPLKCEIRTISLKKETLPEFVRFHPDSGDDKS